MIAVDFYFFMIFSRFRANECCLQYIITVYLYLFITFHRKLVWNFANLPANKKQGTPGSEKSTKLCCPMGSMV
jgi:hypothetical protein